MTRRFEHTDLFRPAARAIIFDGTSILLLHHRKGIIILPGGGANKREKIPDVNLLPIFETKVLDREVKEETGLVIKGKPRIPICSIEWFNDPIERQCGLDFIYAVRVDKETASNARAVGEIVNIEWVRFVDKFILPSNLAPNTRAALTSFSRLLTRERDPGFEFISVA